MIIQFPSANRTRDDEARWDVKFLEIAEFAHFYSTLVIMLVGVAMNLMIIYILKSKPRTRAKCVSSRYPVNGGCGVSNGGVGGGGGIAHRLDGGSIHAGCAGAGVAGSGTVSRHTRVRNRSMSSSELYMCSLAIVDTIFLVSYLLLNRAPSKVSTSDIFQ